MRKGFLSCTAALLAMAGFMMAQAPKTAKEGEAFQNIQKEQNPDERIKKVEEFLSKYKDTELKSMAWQIAAAAADQKRDSVKAIVYAQQALDADPMNYEAMLLMGGEIAQHTRENDLDKNEKLSKAEKLATDAI